MLILFLKKKKKNNNKIIGKANKNVNATQQTVLAKFNYIEIR